MALFGKSRAQDKVTLMIESQDFRFLSLRRGRIHKWGSVSLQPGQVTSGMVSDPQEVGRLIDETFATEGLNRKNVIVGLCGMRAIPRLLRLPRLKASLLESAVSREARREMPVSVENLYLSWQVLPGGGEQQRVYLLGVPRELVDAQLRTLEAAGIRPVSMDLKPLALVRAVGQTEAVIACLEGDILDIVLVVDGLPAIMRTFALDGRDMSPREKLDRLANELTQTIRFYNDSHQTAAIKPNTALYVAGGLLSQPQAIEYLRQVGDRPVELPPAPIPCPPDMPVGMYLTNLGLALKQV